MSLRPNPSIAELRVAADRYCALPWAVVDEQFHVHKGHAFTYTSQLPFRCLEALYIVTLLEKGFGFDKDARDITLALEVSPKQFVLTWLCAMMIPFLLFVRNCYTVCST